jgi:hypothetical protein
MILVKNTPAPILLCNPIPVQPCYSRHRQTEDDALPRLPQPMTKDRSQRHRPLKRAWKVLDRSSRENDTNRSRKGQKHNSHRCDCGDVRLLASHAFRRMPLTWCGRTCRRSNIGERPANTEANTDAEPPPRAEFRCRLATKFRPARRNFVAPPRNSARERSVRYPYFRPILEVASGYWPVIDF